MVIYMVYIWSQGLIRDGDSGLGERWWTEQPTASICSTPGCKLLRLHFSLSQQVQGLWGGSLRLPVYLLSLQAVGEGLPVALRAHPTGAGASFTRNPLGRRCMPGVLKPQRAL